MILFHYCSRNADLPGEFRLSADLFQMTSFTYGEIESETGEKLAQIKSATEEETEESCETLEKIRRRFFNDVLFPRIIVKGIRYAQQQLAMFVNTHKMESSLAEESCCRRCCFACCSIFRSCARLLCHLCGKAARAAIMRPLCA